jgi:hypothetical protein
VELRLGGRVGTVPAVHSSCTGRKGKPMMSYLSQPMFWVSVVIVALVVNWVYQKFMAGKGKLI